MQEDAENCMPFLTSSYHYKLTQLEYLGEFIAHTE